MKIENLNFNRQVIKFDFIINKLIFFSRFTARATVAIPRGSTLFATYTYSLCGTVFRQQHLINGKFFQCLCKRCRDPSELGTYFSALKCRKCQSGNVLPLDALSPVSLWKCENCSFENSSENIAKLLNMLQSEIDNAKSIEKLENLLVKYENLLHSNHFLMIQIKSTLIELYGHVKDFSLSQLSDELLKRKIELCEDVLNILNIFEPGKSRSRGLIMHEIQSAMFLFLKRRLVSEEITQNEYENELSKANQLRDESREILSWEDRNLT